MNDKKCSEDGPFTLKYVQYKFLTPFQLKFCNVFYWAAFFGHKSICYMFLNDLGVSPFIKLYLKRNVVMACITGISRYEDKDKDKVSQLEDTFKFLVVNSHP